MEGGTNTTLIMKSWAFFQRCFRLQCPARTLVRKIYVCSVSIMHLEIYTTLGLNLVWRRAWAWLGIWEATGRGQSSSQNLMVSI